MSCCNRKRTEASYTASSVIKANHFISFQYTGRTALSAVGNITGKRYQFYRPGDIQLIDFNDAEGMDTVPVLKRV